MFLKKVYRHNKWLAVGMLFFVVMQLFVTYKRGMVLSPWYNYGMYSKRMTIQPMYQVNIIPGQKGGDHSPQAWDKLHYTLQQFRLLDRNDSLYEQEITRLFRKAHLPIPDKQHFISDSSIADRWFYDHRTYMGLRVMNLRWNGHSLENSTQH